MDVVNQVTQYLGQIVIAAGGGVLIGLGLFKLYGGKWLDAHFGRRLIDLKAEHDRQLQDLKSVHDASLRHIQSTIDREIHRAKKVYDMEFEAISGAWSKMRVCYDRSSMMDREVYPDLALLSDEQVIESLSRLNMRETDKKALLALPPDQRTEKYKAWALWEEMLQLRRDRKDMVDFIQANAIFMSKEVKAKFESLEQLVLHALAEWHARLTNSDFQSIAHRTAFDEKAPGLRAELEALLRERLWSPDITVARP